MSLNHTILENTQYETAQVFRDDNKMKDRRISLCIVTFKDTHEFHRKVCKALKNLRVALCLRSFHPLLFVLSNLQRASILIKHATVNYLFRAEQGLWSRRARNAWLPRGSQGKLACDHTLSLYLCNLFSGGGHDTILAQIKCKTARIWTLFWLDRKQCGWFALFQLAKMPPSVSCWFKSAFLLA